MLKIFAAHRGDRLEHLQRHRVQTAGQVRLLLLNSGQVTVHLLQELLHLLPVLALGEERLVRRRLLRAGTGVAGGEPAAHVAGEGGRRVPVVRVGKNPAQCFFWVLRFLLGFLFFFGFF
jgi:hypothetical protein